MSAYNAALIRHKGVFVMVTRIDAPDAKAKNGMSQSLAAVALDASFVPMGPHTVLQTGATPSDEDPSLVEFDDDLYVVYNAIGGCGRTMRIGRITMTPSVDGGFSFGIEGIKDMLFTADGTTRCVEKNWTPFVYAGDLHFIYEANPPLVINVAREDLRSNSLKSITASLVSKGTHRVLWNYGEMRGGTPAVYDATRDRYVSFFHSRTMVEGPLGLRLYYVMGFYTFAKEPPFDIEELVSVPLVGPRYYDNPGCISVAFPRGLVIDGNQVHVSYGKDDNAIGVTTFDKAALEADLKPRVRLDELIHAQDDWPKVY